jgi:GTPase SAR1 family protein
MKEKKATIAVFGPRNSGKSSFWAGLYGENSPAASVSFIDDKTMRLVREYWEMLNSGRVLTPNPEGNPSEIHIKLHEMGTTWNLEAREYAGKLVERPSEEEDQTERNEEKLRSQIMKWIKGCDSLLLLLPVDLASESETEQKIYRRALELVVDEFLKNRNKKRSWPICLVLTKWDRLAPCDPETGAEVNPFELDNLPPVVREITRFLEHRTGKENASVFRVSAFGSHAEDDPESPPPTGVKPFGLVETLLWLSKETDKVRKRMGWRWIVAVALLAAAVLVFLQLY